jgi:hypothetical protein
MTGFSGIWRIMEMTMLNFMTKIKDAMPVTKLLLTALTTT